MEYLPMIAIGVVGVMLTYFAVGQWREVLRDRPPAKEWVTPILTTVLAAGAVVLTIFDVVVAIVGSGALR